MNEVLSSTGFGRAGEDLIASILVSEGWKLLERNYRAGRGEIDIIAERGNLIVFIEVKRWRSLGCLDLSRAVNADKIHRIIETSKIYLSTYRKYKNRRIRYDVIFLFRDGIPMRYEGAFDETV
ncbi:MAG: YraN family protein [Spirochaetia bacterium]|jgi:putative endonuclease|nr:YraN family protein [Spirochaetia bacterium]